MSLGIPYMGSKGKLAYKIISHIKEQNPNCKHFFDLFGGGGAISFEALKYFKNVYYNELNRGVVNLLKKIQADGVTDEFFQWVDRETFMANKNKDDWFGGLCKTVWSFGNDQRSYLFGKDIEKIKKEAHFYLMENGYDRTATKRIQLLKQFKQDENIIGRFELQQLEQLQRLESLEISNLSYEQVEINSNINETVIYCDIPYKNTRKYQMNSFCHNKFYEWLGKSKYKIYVSEYGSDLYKVNSWEHRSRLSATANNKVEECLYCNKQEKIYKKIGTNHLF